MKYIALSLEKMLKLTVGTPRKFFGAVLQAIAISLACHTTSGNESTPADPADEIIALPGELNPGPETQVDNTSASGDAESIDSPAAKQISSSLGYQVNSFNGQFGYTVPIVVPPARQGAAPKLGLAYQSSGGNGLCGHGWNLEVGRIERSGRYGVPIKWNGSNPLSEYDDSKGFVMDFGGVRAHLVGVGGDSFRTEVEGAFLVITYLRTANSWEIRDKNGTAFYFGQTTGSRLENTRWGGVPSIDKNTFAWALNAIVDANGNKTEITYTKDAGHLYPFTIYYNGNVNTPALPANHIVQFTIEPRPDRPVSYRMGFRSQLNHRLKEIKTRVLNIQAHRYALSYTVSPSTTRSLLRTVTLYGGDNITATPPLTFTYQEQPFEFGPLETRGTIGSFMPEQSCAIDAQDSGEYKPYNVSNYPSSSLAQIMDFDGDGLPDRMMLKITTANLDRTRETDNQWWMERNTGTGFEMMPEKVQGYLAVMKPFYGNNRAWTAVDNRGFTTAFRQDIFAASTMLRASMADMDGDGRIDRVISDSGDLQALYVSRNDGGKLLPYSPWAGVENQGSNLEEYSGVSRQTGYLGSSIATVRLMDMNSDGRPDRVMMDKDGSTYSKYLVQLNTGAGFSTIVNWSGVTPEFPQFDWAALDASDGRYRRTFATMMDINGDGLIDRVNADYSPPFDHFKVQLNNGSGFDAPEQWGTLNTQGDTTALAAAISSWDSYEWGGGVVRYFYYTQRASLLDVNGDGLPDRVMRRASAPFTNLVVQLNTGFGFGPVLTLGNLLPDPGNEGSYLFRSVETEDLGRNGVVRMIDVNGDGLVDRVMTKMTWPITGDPQVDPTKLDVQLNKGPFPDLLSTIENGFGGKVTVSYIASTSFPNKDHTGANTLPFPVNVVSKVTKEDGFGPPGAFQYKYTGGFFDGMRREFRGFHSVEQIDPTGGRTISYYHQGGGYENVGMGEFGDKDSHAKHGIPYRLERYGSDGALYTLTLNKVEEWQVSGAPNVWFPYISQQIKLDYTGGTPNYYRAALIASSFDAHGNPSSVKEHGEISVSTTATAADWFTWTDLKPDENVRTVTTYAAISGNAHIRNKPELVTVYGSDLAASKLRESRFTYDSRGNLERTEAWLDRTDEWQSGSIGFITQSRARYDQYGNPFESVDAVGVTNIVTYDTSYKTYPVRTDQLAIGNAAMTLTSKAFFNPLCGAETGTIDPNGVVTTNILDSLYRVRETRVSAAEFQEASASLWRTRITYTLGGIANGVSANLVKMQHFDGTDLVDGRVSYVYLDGVGKPIQTRTESETPGTFRVSNTYHDLLERPVHVFRPYFSAGHAYTTLAGSSWQASYTEFDAVGRASRQTEAVNVSFSLSGIPTVSAVSQDAGSPIGVTQTQHYTLSDPWATQVTDPEGKITRTWHDEFGRTYRLENILGGQSVNVYFYFDRLGNLIGSYDPMMKWSQSLYNSLGWKLSSYDPNMSSWSYYYDNVGRLVRQEDAKGNAVVLVYADYFGRKSSKQVFNHLGAIVAATSYTYDAPVIAGHSVFKGQVASVTDSSGSQYFGYDFKGRLEKNTRVVSKNGKTYTIAQTYDSADHLKTVTYPGDTASVQYFYSNGMLSRVESTKGTGATKEIFYKVITRDEFEEPVVWQTHNQTVDNSLELYPVSRRVKERKTLIGAAHLQRLSYTYDKVSNIKSIVDGVYVGNKSASLSGLTYDDLHRLTRVTTAVGVTKNFTYNVGGDILKNEEFGASNYTYDPNHPNAVASANGKAYSYDANGNMINRNGQTLDYDAENRLTRLSIPTVTVEFGYDDGGTRVWKRNVNTGSLTVWIGGYFEDRNGVSLCDVIVDGQTIATFEPQTGGPYAANGRDDSLLRVATSFVTSAADAFEWCFAPGRTGATAIAFAISMATLLFAICFVADRIGGNRRRGFQTGLFHRIVSFVTMVALIVASTNTQVYATSTTPIFHYYATDHLGSSKVITDRAGIVQQHCEFSAFGSQTVKDPNPLPASQIPISKRYTGQVADEETGLYYYGARYYDSELGRFTQPDPSSPPITTTQSVNRYAYCLNNPLNNTDPTGLATVSAYSSSITGGGFPNYNMYLPDLREMHNSMAGFLSHPAYESIDFGSRGFGGGSSSDEAFELAGVPTPSALLENIAHPSMSAMERQVVGPSFADHPTSERMTWLDVGKAALTIASFVPGPIGITAGLGLAAISAQEGDILGAVIGVGAAVAAVAGIFSAVAKARTAGRSVSLAREAPNPITGRGYGVNDPPVRIQGTWGDADFRSALLGRPPPSLGRPDLHHAGQMPGSAVHEIIPALHRGNPALHPNKLNQGVTPQMRTQDRQLHWWYRAREQGADRLYPNLIYDP